MKRKYILYSYLILTIFILFRCNNSQKPKEKYKQDIGYINPQTSRYAENFKLCSDGRFFGGYYSSHAPKVYKNNKISFRKHIQNNYKNKNYNDNGFLNLRFHINCEGNVGNVEVNELDENLKLSNLNKELVQQLIDLSIDKNNWNAFEYKGEKFDTYMYLIFKIEHGNITEILP